MQRIEWALEVAGAGENLAVDANGRFDLDTALAYAQAMERYGLGWFEEPVEPLDYRAHAVLCDATDIPIATGENLFSVQDFRNLVRHGGMRPHKDWLQPDPSLCYGLTECLRILAMADRAGWSRRRCVPHGGHQLGLNMAAGLQLGRHRELSRRVQALRRICRHDSGRRRLHLRHTRRRASAWSCERTCSPTCASGWSWTERSVFVLLPLAEKVVRRTRMRGPSRPMKESRPRRARPNDLRSRVELMTGPVRERDRKSWPHVLSPRGEAVECL